MKVSLQHKQIARNEKGDPDFRDLSSIMGVFSENEIVELVNRCLYQLEYQRTSHEKRNRERAALEAPLKLAMKSLYPGTSWAKATEQQIEKCFELVKSAWK